MPDTGQLDRITTFPQLLTYLEEELGWPIDANSFDEVTFDYSPADFSLKPEELGGGVEIKQLRPLAANQPWGIFFLGLPHKTLPVTVLRRILGRLAVKKRKSGNPADRAVFAKSDLLFIAATGAGGERRLAFAHFRDDPATGDAPMLRVLGWDADDTVRRLSRTHAVLTERLAWPDDGGRDPDAWRARWASAFTERKGESVRTSRDMAVALAALARSIRDRARTLLDVETESGPLRRLHKAFRDALIHDLAPCDFADMYAQTIAYGLLSARIGRPAATAAGDGSQAPVPLTSPFLREMFGTFMDAGERRPGSGGDAGLDFDELGVGDVVDLLNRANMAAVLADFDRNNPDEDPVIHFYELFLAAYDKGQKLKRGVFYTPRPAVSFIVRSVHEVLRSEFGLEDGLASTATWADVISAGTGIALPADTQPGDPFVRILDPTTGTGTFLVECIDLIHATMIAKWKKAGKNAKEIKGLWNAYVDSHLLPRLTGFELMMAPYAIAHVKLGLKLHDTGYDFTGEARARVYLTNALEPARDLDMELAFASEALAQEAQAANAAKGTRFTVVVGNPPYSEKSANMQDFAKRHIEPFRVANGAKIKMRNMLQHERNLNDDYVKFFGLALGQVGIGAVGLITNRYFLESNSLVGLRQVIGSASGASRIVDLMGSAEEAQRVERLKDDENIFDIKQGVAIAIIARNPRSGRHESCSDVLIGSRVSKHCWLSSSRTGVANSGTAVEPQGPDWTLGRRAVAKVDLFKIDTIFAHFSTLVASNRDPIVVGFDNGEVTDRVRDVASSELADLPWSEQFGITLKTNWNVKSARSHLRSLVVEDHIKPIEYRPFDRRAIFYHKSLVWQMAPVPSDNALGVAGNVVLIALGKNRDERTNGFWVARGLADKSAVGTRDNASGFPLWLRPQGAETRTLPNLDPNFTRRLAALTGLAWDDCVEGAETGSAGPAAWRTPAPGAAPATRRERGEPGKSFGPRDLFDYIYAVLHSPDYRRLYAEHLKNDFARIPLPGNAELFEALVRLGGELVALHLLDADALPILEDPAVRLAGSGEARIALPPARFEKDAFAGDRLYISANRWFEPVPQAAADFQVGGYRPARKWLRDRAGKGGAPGRLLSEADILHYRRMIAALGRTAELMPRIDEAIGAHGGWPGAFEGMADAPAAERQPRP